MVGTCQDLESGLCITNYIRIITISDTHFVELKSVKDFFFFGRMGLDMWNKDRLGLI